MMKKIRLITILGTTALAVLSIACNRITYQGDYNLDGLYTGKKMIYFDYKTVKSDSVRSYTFGALPAEVESHVVKIPLRIMGETPTTPLSYKVEVIKEKSTAIEGKHYLPLNEKYAFRANEVTDTLEITLLRNALPAEVAEGEEKKAEVLAFRLVSTDDLQVALESSNLCKVEFHNYLNEPYWWVYYHPYLGDYHRLKYLKLLEGYNNSEQEMEQTLHGSAGYPRLIMNAKRMYDYFVEHPELEVPLPANDPSIFSTFIE